MKFKRLFSAFLDCCIASTIALPIVWIIQDIFNIQSASLVTNNNLKGIIEFYSYSFKEISFWLQNVLIWIVFCFKDLVFKNASIAKKKIKLKILTLDNRKPTIFTLIFRNVFLFIWPIEVIMLLIFNKRLGDIIFKTKVVENNIIN